ncbi:MAG: AAA family ATPase [Lachnospiraceae bacterium]|nr:AAA family ATPase [Lachnospiraceae bacterium]
MKINKPQFINGYISEEGHYKLLHVDPFIDEKDFRHDICNGASHFMECEKVLKPDASKYIIVEADNEEEGFVAVSYIHALIRDKMKKKENDKFNSFMNEPSFDEGYVDNDETWDGWYDECINDNELEDVNENYDEPCEEEDRYLDADDPFYYIETGDDIPIIDMTDVLIALNCKNNQMLPFEGMMTMGGLRQNHEPYWMGIADRTVCIVKIGFGGSEILSDEEISALRYFEDCNHVICLYIREGNLKEGRLHFLAEDDLISNYSSYNSKKDELFEDEAPVLSKAVLSLTADHIEVGCSKEERKAYQEKLFADWVDYYNFIIENPGDIHDMTEKIVKIDVDMPSEYMDKTLKLIKHNMPDVKIISMKTLRTLGIAGMKHDSKYSRNQEEKLDNLLGMEETKRELKSIVKLLKFQRERKQKGVNVEGQHNVFMFLGAPGTAKTTAAKALGSMLREERLLKRDRFISVNGSQLKAGYVGQTAARVENLFKNYDIILIDEAYSLTASQNGEMDIFGQEALAQLAIELERHAEDKVVIFAGYGGKSVTKKDNKMEGFLTANPGIKSRINHVIYFDSYSPEVMVRMVHAMAKRKGYKMLKSADTELTAYFTERCADKAFGNGREARRFLENMERVVAERFYDLGLIPGEIITVKKSDVINTIASVRGCDMREHTRYGLI